MTSDKIALVQESFQKVPTRADQAAEIFTSISLPWIPVEELISRGYASAGEKTHADDRDRCQRAEDS